ncbi:DUF3052 family protein [Pseudoxanthomonas suwonensis]|uniref:DUF3052 domain-containing protein n=1 Tax=Pseudoxanthomonas suwonensis TaxID=314722 RepID=A0A0E3YZL2_9GAMM|nr:DUF3052 family protein [Pseudoxanthomonas suwonensis]AKC85513.1 hypothetical protein WQ53_00755 [Pseudoxanthomonas suwonensis]
MTNPTGYSGTPLARKLGITAGSRLVARHAPDEYAQWVAPLPPDVSFGRRVTEATDLVHVFVVDRSVLERELVSLRKAVRADAAVWVSWPKKASKVPTDVSEDVIREACLPLGFVDVKVCAVSDVWSGLKLVIRKELR